MVKLFPKALLLALLVGMPVMAKQAELGKSVMINIIYINL